MAISGPSRLHPHSPYRVTLALEDVAFRSANSPRVVFFLYDPRVIRGERLRALRSALKYYQHLSFAQIAILASQNDLLLLLIRFSSPAASANVTASGAFGVAMATLTTSSTRSRRESNRQSWQRRDDVITSSSR